MLLNIAKIFSTLGLLFLLISIAGGSWWYSNQQIRPFIEADDRISLAINDIKTGWQQLILGSKTESFENITTLSSLNNTEINQNGSLILIHLWNPNCFCNQLSARHLAPLLDKYNNDELKLWVLTPVTTTEQQINEYQKLNPRIEKIIRTNGKEQSLTASPGLALASSGGELHYYGAYGFGALCTPSGENFFSNLIQRIKRGVKGPFLNIAGKGCFCDWPIRDKTLK